MSDGFDKEAEREKLREKLADDEQKREHTQRMSELLLKGATMTNRHCGECGDPIFRHDGREFCPTCGNEAAAAAGEGETSDTAGDANAAGADASGTATDTSANATGAAENGSVDVEPTDTAGAADTVEPADTAGAGSVDAGANERAQSRSPSQTSAPSRESASPRQSESRQSPPSRPVDDGEGVGTARASLTRTLTRFARAAEETDDPRRARDHLEAAREAAEALAALER